MKKGLKIFLIGFVLLAGGLAAYFYFNPKKALKIIFPELDKIEKIHIRLKKDSALVRASLTLVNKSLFKLNTDSLIYTIRIDTSVLLSGAQALDIELEPSETDTLDLPLALPFKRLLAEIERLGDQDNVAIDLDLRVVYATIFGKTSLPLKRTITIEVPLPPKFEMQRIEYLKREKKTFYFNAYIKVINKGKLDLSLSDIQYHLTVKDNFTARGKNPGNIHLDPTSEMIVVLPIRIESEHWLKTIANILTDNDKVSYYLKINAMLQADNLDKEKTSIEIERSGMIDLKNEIKARKLK